MVYCIIVTYNAMKWIDRCLTELHNSSVVPKIVTIDNCSKDDTVRYIKANYPFVHVIENKNNNGFGGANNQGIEYAYRQGGTHFLLLNQDAYVHYDTIEKLVNIQDKTGADLVSPIHLNGNGNQMDGEFYNNYFGASNGNKVCTDLLKGEEEEFYYTSAAINAAAWMLSRKAIDEIGGFDPLFYHYGEDNNYLQRLWYHGRKVAVVTGSFINHDRGEHGNMKMYNKQTAIKALLMVYLDINIHSFSYYLNRHLKDVAKFLLFVFTFQLKKSIYLIRAYYIFVQNWYKYKYSRNENKKIQPNWLHV